MDREDRLAEAFGRWQEAVDGGAPVTPEEACRECPELLAEFREILPRLAAVHALFGEDDAEPHPAADLSSNEIREFGSLVFHKQGGLGVVLVGEDVDLRRTVAVKRMKPKSAADPALCDRFVEEAELTAKLEHPGVVPVYRKGTDAQGRPYYAMRFIQGETLGEAIAGYYKFAERDPESPDRRLAFRHLLRALVSVCETTAFAHSRGIVHRDLKPENIMLGPFGETLVLDWGLAKRIRRTAGVETESYEQPDTAAAAADSHGPSNTSRSLSIDGKAKGSPAFMSPEQARGDWKTVGPLSDVYGLGATLYAILTGANPFTGRDAHEIIEHVKQGRFPRPGARRAGVDRGLEAVCLKAMSLDPADRYHDARQLAAEIERHLADEPLAAWRDPPTVRIRRWMRRHSSLVAGGTILLLLSAVGAVGATVLEQRRAAELDRVNAQFRRLIVAMNPPLADAAAVTRQIDALEESRRFFAALDRVDDPRYLLEMSIVDNATGVLHLHRNEHQQAAELFKRAEDQLQEALRRKPADPELIAARATVQKNMGAALMPAGAARALGWFEKSLGEFDELVRIFPKEEKYQAAQTQVYRGLGFAHAGMAADHWSARRIPEALSEFDEAHFLLSTLQLQEHDLPGFAEGYDAFLRDYGEALLLTAQRARDDGKRSEALELYRRADGVWFNLERRQPQDENIRDKLEQAWLGLAFVTRDHLENFVGNAVPPAERRRMAQEIVAKLDGMKAKWRSDAEWLRLRADLEKLRSSAGDVSR